MTVTPLAGCLPAAAYMSSPCHIELILTEKEQAVKAELVSVGRTMSLRCLAPSKVAAERAKEEGGEGALA